MAILVGRTLHRPTAAHGPAGEQRTGARPARSRRSADQAAHVERLDQRTAATEMKSEFGISFLYITHDLSTAYQISDDIYILYLGSVMEKGDIEAVMQDPQHPYTQGLLGSLPRLEGRTAERLTNIKGQPPNLLSAPESCPFAPRCLYVFERCLEENPAILPISSIHEVACWWDTAKGEPRHDR